MIVMPIVECTWVTRTLEKARGSIEQIEHETLENRREATQKQRKEEEYRCRSSDEELDKLVCL